MPDAIGRFAPGSLWQTIVARSRSALARGALQPIATEIRTVVDHGVHFDVRVVSSLARKIADNQGHWPTPASGEHRANPFLPYERDLFVADISASHLCLLNKYNVIDHHVLIVTRAFEPQENRLTPADFEALWSCMAEFDALGFYNSGPLAGASQPHKHLQLAPLPLSAHTPDIATSVLFGAPSRAGKPTRIAKLPFTHAFAWLDQPHTESHAARAAETHALYGDLLAAAGLDPTGPEPKPYNLLVTRRFMLLVPRRLERVDRVAVNALGFAGSFFVARPQSLDVVVRIGPMELLSKVSLPTSGAV
jgi:ATP adenylyltransferase